MVMTDPIADLLTRIRNANLRHKDTLEIPASKMKAEILRVLTEEGYINGYKSKNDENNHPVLVAELKYNGTERIIKGLKRISKPGLRVYAKVGQLPRVLNGLGIAVISTSKGIMTDREARKQNIGGEVLAYVW